jgi:hypothetical protein
MRCTISQRTDTRLKLTLTMAAIQNINLTVRRQAQMRYARFYGYLETGNKVLKQNPIGCTDLDLHVTFRFRCNQTLLYS